MMQLRPEQEQVLKDLMQYISFDNDGHYNDEKMEFGHKMLAVRGSELGVLSIKDFGKSGDGADIQLTPEATEWIKQHKELKEGRGNEIDTR